MLSQLWEQLSGTSKPSTIVIKGCPADPVPPLRQSSSTGPGKASEAFSFFFFFFFFFVFLRPFLKLGRKEFLIA